MIYSFYGVGRTLDNIIFNGMRERPILNISEKRTKHFPGRIIQGWILSALIGILVVLGFITVSIVSGINKGEGGLLLGIIGILLFVFAVFGFVLSYKEMKKRDIYYRFPMIGIITNGIMLILLVIIYILGLY